MRAWKARGFIGGVLFVGFIGLFKLHLYLEVDDLCSTRDPDTEVQYSEYAT